MTEAVRIKRFAGAFAVVKRQGESKISAANAGAKPPNRTACPVLTGSASQWTRRV